jgi:PIN domain nuclease of toxin-antitoxin system
VNLLLDTHTLLWWDSKPSLLGEAARIAMRDASNAVFVSAASVWEIAIKQKSGKLSFAGLPAAMIAQYGFLPLLISPEHAERAGGLPPHHTDPFDRMLIAQAQIEGMTLVTVDSKIRLYPVAQLWARA